MLDAYDNAVILLGAAGWTVRWWRWMLWHGHGRHVHCMPGVLLRNPVTIATQPRTSQPSSSPSVSIIITITTCRFSSSSPPIVSTSSHTHTSACTSRPLASLDHGGSIFPTSTTPATGEHNNPCWDTTRQAAPQPPRARPLPSRPQPVHLDQLTSQHRAPLL